MTNNDVTVNCISLLVLITRGIKKNIEYNNKLLTSEKTRPSEISKTNIDLTDTIITTIRNVIIGALTGDLLIKNFLLNTIFRAKKPYKKNIIASCKPIAYRFPIGKLTTS
jgi:hypothetical protein